MAWMVAGLRQTGRHLQGRARISGLRDRATDRSVRC
jgi:hypothetical protein